MLVSTLTLHGKDNRQIVISVYSGGEYRIRTCGGLLNPQLFSKQSRSTTLAILRGLFLYINLVIGHLLNLEAIGSSQPTYIRLKFLPNHSKSQPRLPQ